MCAFEEFIYVDSRGQNNLEAGTSWYHGGKLALLGYIVAMRTLSAQGNSKPRQRHKSLFLKSCFRISLYFLLLESNGKPLTK